MLERACQDSHFRMLFVVALHASRLVECRGKRISCAAPFECGSRGSDGMSVMMTVSMVVVLTWTEASLFFE
jgi:hypothetical protein